MNRRDVTSQRASVVREPSAPLILWICSAICVHFMVAEGGTSVAETHDARTFFASLAAEARTIASRSNIPVEIDITSEPTKDEATDADKPVVDDKEETLVAKKGEKRDEPPKPMPPKPKPPEPEVKVVQKQITVAPEDPLKKLEEKKLLNKDDRVAVVQHTKKDQDDNDKARFIADEANRVEEEKVAKLTSHDRDDENPTPGGNHSGPQGDVGDSTRTKIAESEEHEGNKERAPGEKGTEFDVQPLPMPTKPMGAVAIKGPDAKMPTQSGGDGKQPGANAAPADRPEMAPSDRAQQPHDIIGGAQGGWSFNPISPNHGSGSAKDSNTGTAPRDPKKLGSTAWMGLGGKPGPGQINLNLSHEGAVAVIGQDQLRKEREADGERRKSEHRGSFVASNFERWRSAIENYVTTVKPGNQTALNTARVPFATYLNHIHNRIHPIFADSFLESLGGLPRTHPLNDNTLVTHLEIVLSKEGRIVKMGIAKSSRVTAFDIAALDAVDRASPFGPAPSAILSTDGNVYLHWEFHREEVFACSTANARPFMLNVPTAPTPAQPPPRDPNRENPRQERGAPPPVNVREHREGSLGPNHQPSRGAF